jgi:PadR family transcriptional regulator PadR
MYIFTIHRLIRIVMGIEKWKSQLRKGTTEFAVLLVLENKELYGLAILDILTNSKGLAIAEGTIYPILNRLQKEGKIEAQWVEDDSSNHPRKYYRLTSQGNQILSEMKTVWEEFQESLNVLNKGDFSNDE